MPVAQAISTLKGSWTRLLDDERLRRSSQVLSVVGQTICIFGGEVQPREPVDDKLDLFPLTRATSSLKLETKAVPDGPSPRVGSASAVVNGKMYLFSGRGGIDMAPVEEHGAVWAFDPNSSQWTKLTPADASAPYPPARSYHCCASDGRDAFFLHAGCPAKGRLSDLWKFSVSERTWSQEPEAPAPQRGGTSIAYRGGKIYRMNGFDGTTEQGGSLDVFDVERRAWSTRAFKADGRDGPEARSVCVLLPVRLAGKDKLLTLFGERDPSSLGHAGAGKMLSDVWIYDITENWWTQLQPEGPEGFPAPRGWFDADVVRAEAGNDSVVVHGGLGESNERLTDLWKLDF